MFMRHTNMFGWLGMQVFNAVPFIYELRALLDWSCTPTTLTLFDWLKLEVSLLSGICWMCVCVNVDPAWIDMLTLLDSFNLKVKLLDASADPAHM